ncbi:hypothetical protein [Pontibacter fetidus]|uniref:YD repeat-containing protein n=1 Tax=Pontibacter fetidus TaxID=2700082 RepID=A0A6B2GXH0_9BACT|nr:hypothetical protein [Pontibacter fetidus]NDK54671.1 hypothetical protein [Pontibacter fetidus]
MKLNITSKLLSLFAVAALTFTACGDKDDDAQPNANLTPCKITAVSDDEGSSTAFSYNTAGYITSITQVEIDGEEEYEYTTNYTYDSSNKLVKEEFTENGEVYGYITYEYSNGMVSKSKEYYDGELSYTATFTYDGSKRLSKITEVTSDEEEYSMTFAYNSAGNVTQTEVKYMGQVFMRTKYENYDSKLTPYAAAKGPLNLYEGTGNNNPGKVTTTYLWGEEPEVYTSTYTYVYSDKNLPTKITETDDDGTQYITNFTYQCN